MSNCEPNGPEFGDMHIARVNGCHRFGGRSFCIPSPTHVFIGLANPSDHARAGKPTEDATTTVEDEAVSDRSRCADGFGNGTVPRPRHVVLSIGRPICGRQQLHGTS